MARGGGAPASVLGPGDVVGKYEIVRVLGSGGMGIVYEARHPVLESRLVIKTLHATLQHSAALAERFRNEALAASRLRDDRLPQIFDVDQLADGTQYLVMEFLDGEDLARRLRRGALAPGYAARVIIEVLDVLAKVHRLGIVHRDIKPANIFLARSDLLGEVPKLLDFGVAHMATAEVTPAGLMLGTPAYMAPEQALGDAPIGPAADIFATGVMLFELIAGPGERPWECETPFAYYQALAQKVPPRPLVAVAPACPPSLAAVVARALARMPGDRFPTASAFARALEPFAIERGELSAAGAAYAAPPAPLPPPPPRSTAAEQPRLDGTAAATGVIDRPARPAESEPARPPTEVVSSMKLAGLRSGLDRLRRGGSTGPQPPSPGSGPRLQPGERRHVTACYVETQLSPTGSQVLAAEEEEQLLGEFLDVFQGELAAAGAHVRAQPDGTLLALFGFDQAHEDDAERAVAALMAVGRRRAEANALLGSVGYTLSIRSGVHAGFALRVPGAQQAPMAGETAAVARRLAEHAPWSGILASAEVVDLAAGAFHTRHVGKVALKGRGQPIDTHEVMGRRDERWGESGARPGDPPGDDWRGAGPPSAEGRGAPTGDAATEAGPVGMVGRAAELARLEELLARPPAEQPGPPTVALVAGPAGSGKTRLVSELLSRLDPAAPWSPRVVRVQPAASEPYSLWSALLRVLLPLRASALDDTDVSQLDQPLLTLAAGLPPERQRQLLAQASVIRALLGGAGTDSLADESPQANGERIQSAVALCLEAAASGPRPLLLCLENLHRADGASLQLLGKVLPLVAVAAGAPRRAPLAILTVRETQTLALPDELPCVPIALAPLDAEESARLAERSSHGLLSEAASDFVVRHAGGSPLFIEELVESLRQRRLLGASAERLRSFTPPTSLYGLLLERLDRLEPPLRELLRVASVLGVEFDAAALLDTAQAARGLSLPTSPTIDPAAGIEELVRRGVLDRVDARAAAGHGEQPADDEARAAVARRERCAFHQAQMQGAVYGTILSENRRLLHRLAGEAIERVAAGRLEGSLGELLHHFSQTEDLERSVRYARLGGRRALQLGAYEEAVESLLLAVAQQEQLAEDGPLPRARTLLDLATACLWSGRLVEGAIRAAQATELLPAPGGGEAAPEVLITAARVAMVRAQIAGLRADGAEAEASFDRAEQSFAAAALPADAAMARCCRGFALRSLGRLEEGLLLARQGWAVLQGSGDLAGIARAGHDLGNVLRDLGAHDEALAIFDRAIAAGDELAARGNLLEAMWGALAARSGRGMTYASLGRLAEAVADQRAVIELARRGGHRVAQLIASYHLASHLVEQGDLREADRVAEQALQMALGASMTGRAVRCRLLQVRIAELRGDLGAAIGLVEDAGQIAARLQLAEAAWPPLLEAFERLGRSVDLGAAAPRDRERLALARTRAEALRARAAGDPLTPVTLPATPRRSRE